MKFLYGTTVEGLDIEGDRVRAVMTSAGPVSGDAVVISMGPESGLLGRRYGIDLPVYPVKGYTATIPLEDESKGPTMGGADEDQLIGLFPARQPAAACLDGRIHRLRPHASATATSPPCSGPARSCFPGAFDEKKAELWAGLGR